jgi:hypothetical protein
MAPGEVCRFCGSGTHTVLAGIPHRLVPCDDLRELLNPPDEAEPGPGSRRRRRRPKPTSDEEDTDAQHTDTGGTARRA